MIKMYREYDNFVLSIATEQENPIKYRSVVMEAVKNESTVRARLVDIMYQDIVARKNYDFDVIPYTRGDVTKMPSYDTFLASMDALKQITVNEKKGQVYDTVKLVEDLHSKIVIRRDDFEYGYKLHVDILQVAYCTAVSALYQLMNLCVSAISHTLTDGWSLSQAFNKVCGRNEYLVTVAMHLNSGLNDKNWKEFITPIRGKRNTFFKGAVSKFGGFIGDAGATLSNAIATTGVIGTGIIATTSAIREGIYGLYVKRGKVSDWAENQKALIDHAAQTNPNWKNDKSTQLANKALTMLSGKVDRELEILDKEAAKELHSPEVKRNYSHENLRKNPNLPTPEVQQQASEPRTTDSDVMLF